MPGFILDAGVSITCPHGGQASVVASTTRVRLSGNPPLVASDEASIAGCAFNISGSPSPCARVQWLMPAVRVKVEGTPVLLSTSVALCVSGASVPQGPGIVTGFQTKVRAQ